jgi:hypothetical protein
MTTDSLPAPLKAAIDDRTSMAVVGCRGSRYWNRIDNGHE